MHSVRSFFGFTTAVFSMHEPLESLPDAALHVRRACLEGACWTFTLGAAGLGALSTGLFLFSRDLLDARKKGSEWVSLSGVGAAAFAGGCFFASRKLEKRLKEVTRVLRTSERSFGELFDSGLLDRLPLERRRAKFAALRKSVLQRNSSEKLAFLEKFSPHFPSLLAAKVIDLADCRFDAYGVDPVSAWDSQAGKWCFPLRRKVFTKKEFEKLSKEERQESLRQQALYEKISNLYAILCTPCQVFDPAGVCFSPQDVSNRYEQAYEHFRARVAKVLAEAAADLADCKN